MGYNHILLVAILCGKAIWYIYSEYTKHGNIFCNGIFIDYIWMGGLGHYFIGNVGYMWINYYMWDNMLKISIGSWGRIVNFVLASKCSMGVLKFLNKIPKNTMNTFYMGKKFVELINFNCLESELEFLTTL